MNEVNQDKIWRHFQGAGSESFAASHPRLRYLVRQAKGWAPANGRRLLNIGVGDGYLEGLAIAVGLEVHSLDPDSEAIARVCQNGTKGVTGIIEAMPFESETFDVVVASEVLEHLSEKQRLAGLQEVARVLKPDGRFLGTTPYNEDLFLGRTVCPCCGVVFHRWGHQASFTMRSMRAGLEKHFFVERLTRTAFPNFGRYPEAMGLGAIKGAIRIVLAKLGQQIASPNIYFAARRK
jgi:SAM-dependent methyltransferase